MAKTCLWVGDAVGSQKEYRPTPGGTIGTETFTITVGNESVTYTAVGGDTVALVVAGLHAAWVAAKASTPVILEISLITSTDQTTYLELKHDTAGVDYEITCSATGAATLTANEQTSTKVGPNWWSDLGNWVDPNGAQLASLPTGIDMVHLVRGGSILYGTDQTGMTGTLAALHRWASYTGQVGLPVVNALGYHEYLGTYLQIAATNVYIGQGAGDNSTLFKLDSGATQTALVIDGSGAAATDGTPAILWKGTHASNAAVINRGSVGLGFFPGESATLNTLKVGYKTNQSSDAVVYGGDNLTLSAVTKSGGILHLRDDVATIVQGESGGELYLDGGMLVSGSAKIYGGVIYPLETGSLGGLEIMDGGTLDMRRSLSSVSAYGGIVLHKGAKVYDPSGRISFSSGGWQLIECGVHQLGKFETPADKTWNFT